MSKRVDGRFLAAMPILLLTLVVTALPATLSAAELVACEVEQSDDSVRIEITANGEWTHRSFLVDDPERFVLDLVGVEVGKVSSRIEADGRFVDAVRTSQYSGGLNPVARVVLDLVEGTRVAVEPSDKGLALVAFGSAAPAQSEWANADVAQPGVESVVWDSAPTEWPEEPAGADHWQGVGRIADSDTDDTSYARTMSINMQNADIRTVLRAIADFSGRNIISSPDVSGTVTVAITDMPWREVLGAILKANGFAYVDESGIIRVDTSDKLREERVAEKAAAQRIAELEPLQTKVVSIDYANAEEVRQSASAVLSSRGKVETDQRTNSLVISDTPSIVSRVTTLARELDTRTPQVHINALMVDLDSRRTRELGVKWGVLDARPPEVNVAGDVVVDRPITDSAGTLRVGTVQSWGEVQLQLQALARRNLANIVSNPSITTTDNREASILVGQKIPLITQDVAGNAVTQLETIGIRLVVTPHINSDRQITLDVHPEVSDLSSQATVQGGVIINTNEADTRVLVANHETAVIAGLIRNVVSDFNSGVPVLKDIPLLGGLFRSSSKNEEQRELVVFLTPHIVEDGESMATERHWQIKDRVEEVTVENQQEIID
jgi:type IV pilus assembly protein PilQ